jgi:hypothetical protein
MIFFFFILYIYIHTFMLYLFIPHLATPKKNTYNNIHYVSMCMKSLIIDHRDFCIAVKQSYYW